MNGLTSDPEPPDDTKLIGLLRRLVWLYSDDFEKATLANKAVGDKNAAAQAADPDAKLDEYPFSEKQMRQMEKDMLTQQIALEREESNT